MHIYRQAVTDAHHWWFWNILLRFSASFYINYALGFAANYSLHKFWVIYPACFFFFHFILHNRGPKLQLSAPFLFCLEYGPKNGRFPHSNGFLKAASGEMLPFRICVCVYMYVCVSVCVYVSVYVCMWWCIDAWKNIWLLESNFFRDASFLNSWMRIYVHAYVCLSMFWVCL
jgi:hypothetical protein